MGLIILIALGLIIYAFWNPKDGGFPSKEKSALEILRDRYAKGEIDEEEFRRRKETLSE